MIVQNGAHNYDTIENSQRIQILWNIEKYTTYLGGVCKSTFTLFFILEKPKAP